MSASFGDSHDLESPGFKKVHSGKFLKKSRFYKKVLGLNEFHFLIHSVILVKFITNWHH